MITVQLVALMRWIATVWTIPSRKVLNCIVLAKRMRNSERKSRALPIPGLFGEGAHMA